MSFAEFWTPWLNERKPHLEPGTWEAYERDGRLRLLPALGSLPLEKLEVENVRGVKEELVEAMQDGELAAKTINNSLGTLVVCLNAAVEDKLIAASPALRVPRLPLPILSATTCVCTRSRSISTPARRSIARWLSC
jgi:Phage integrase, N-terminal SAM-like domain